MNSLYQEMTNAPLNSRLKEIRGMMRKMKMVSNPKQAVMDMAKNNPQIKAIMTLSQQKNMSLENIFYEMAKEQGVNPDDVLKALQ